MRRIRDWSIRTRLFLAFGGILLLFVALAGIVVVGSRGVRQSLRTIQDGAALEMQRTVDLGVSWHQLVLAMKDYAVTGGPMERMQLERRAALFEAAFRSLANTPMGDAEEQQLIEVLRGIVADIAARCQEVLAASKAPTHRDAVATIEKLIRRNDYIEPILHRLREIQIGEFEALVQHASSRSRQPDTMTYTVVLLAVAVAATLAMLLSDWINRPIQAITRGSRRMGEGDLSHRVEVDAGGELGEAANAFNAMAERLEQSAIENTRLYDAAAQRGDRIAAINRLTAVISSSLDLGAVYDAFAKELKPLIPYNRMGVVLPDDSGKGLRTMHLATDRPSEAMNGRIWENSEGTGIAWVMSHGQPHIAQDLAEARLFVENGVLSKAGIRSTIRLPLIAKGEVIGALFLDDVEPGRYTENDLALLVPIGEQLAIAIENARLHYELEQRVEERTRDLKQTQAQLIQSGKLAAVGTLAAGVAHELNQPLMVIRGYAQELLADERVASEEIREDLRRIGAQTTRMSAIINHLRDFSRQSKGKRQVTDLNQVVTDALAFLGQQLKIKNITVVQELVPAPPPVWADPLQIEQVLLNLITNARDAMEAAGMGTITIRAELVAGGRVALSVTDTGPGIPPDLQARIFDPFFTTKEIGKGTGLGLSICHGIVEEHGGELTTESPVADGRGARFTITLSRSLGDDTEEERA